MASPPTDLAIVVSRYLSQATASWGGAIRLALVLAAAAAGPAAIIVLIAVTR